MRQWQFTGRRKQSSESH